MGKSWLREAILSFARNLWMCRLPGQPRARHIEREDRKHCQHEMAKIPSIIHHKDMDLWRENFVASIPKVTRSNLRKMTRLLTGRSAPNYTLNKYKLDKSPKACPHCLAEEDMVIHSSAVALGGQQKEVHFLTLST